MENLRDELYDIILTHCFVTDGFGGAKLADWEYGYEVMVDGIDEAVDAILSRLTPHQPDAAITPAGAPEVETGGYMIEQWVNNNRWRALYGPFETLEKAREVRGRSKITPTRIVLQQKVVIEQ